MSSSWLERSRCLARGFCFEDRWFCRANCSSVHPVLGADHTPPVPDSSPSCNRRVVALEWNREDVRKHRDRMHRARGSWFEGHSFAHASWSSARLVLAWDHTALARVWHRPRDLWAFLRWSKQAREKLSIQLWSSKNRARECHRNPPYCLLVRLLKILFDLWNSVRRDYTLGNMCIALERHAFGFHLVHTNALKLFLRKFIVYSQTHTLIGYMHKRFTRRKYKLVQM